MKKMRSSAFSVPQQDEEQVGKENQGSPKQQKRSLPTSTRTVARVYNVSSAAAAAASSVPVSLHAREEEQGVDRRVQLAAQRAMLRSSETEEAEAEAREFEESEYGFALISRMKLPPLGTPCTEEQKKELLRACQEGDIPAIRLIIQHVPIRTKLTYSLQAIHYAAREGQTEAVHLLLTTGTDIEAKTSGGRTPLMLGSNHVATIRLLLSAGADPNTQDKYGRSLLFFLKSPDEIVALVEAGADLTLRNHRGKTPLEHWTQELAGHLTWDEMFQNQDDIASYQARITALERCEEMESSSGLSAADRRVLWLQTGMRRRNDLAFEVTGEGDGGWTRGVHIEMARIIVDYMGADEVPWACVIEVERDLKHTQSLQAAIEGVEEACEAAAAAAAVQGCGGGGGGGGGGGDEV